MRPPLLFPLFASVHGLPGIGPKTYSHLVRLGCEKILDLLYHAPSSLQYRHGITSLKDAKIGTLITIELTVRQHMPPTSKSHKSPYMVRCQDETGLFLDLLFFKPNTQLLTDQCPPEQTLVVSGKFEKNNGKWQITHPDFFGPIQQKNDWIGYFPIYPLTYGLTQRGLYKTIQNALKRAPLSPEWVPLHRLRQQEWLSWQSSISALHHPSSPNDLCEDSKARQRLIYDEIFANQLMMVLSKNKRCMMDGISIQPRTPIQQECIQNLPFNLTSDQLQALDEINKDMQSSKKMVRLLQGDVGSGKTIVALLAILNAISAGYQAALLVPTEVLAQQHHANITNLLQNFDINIGILTASIKNKKHIYTQLQSGELNIVIGTHALLQEDVQFTKLGLIVIDEQHRFGVEQRLKLQQQAPKADILVMSATPIPRTLMLSAHGDLDNSIILEKPANRLEIKTKAIPVKRLSEVIAGLQRAIENNEKAYWVCPLVDESEKLDLIAATERFNELIKVFPNQIGLIHGRMKACEKEEIINLFRAGAIKILVATTVIEVGIDIPDASIIIIEHAERFGLAQLHQLRGRVGRGSKQSSCILLYGDHITPVAKSRLEVMRNTGDGFIIAEQDLKLRGGGDILGLNQSGSSQLKLSLLENVNDLLEMAHQDAIDLLNQDPKMNSEQGKAARVLLHLFDFNYAIKLIESG